LYNYVHYKIATKLSEFPGHYGSLMLNPRGGYFRTTFHTSAPRTGAEPHFRCGIDGVEPAEKKMRNGGCGTIKITFAPPNRQKTISIRMAIIYHFSIDLWTFETQ